MLIGDIIAAIRRLIAQKLMGMMPMQGAPFIGYHTGVKYAPHYIAKAGATLSVPSTRMYYAPYLVQEEVAFASIVTYNAGAGDNGDTYRLAIYANDGAVGPGTLIQDIGQVTLTGAAASRVLTATIDLRAYVGKWVWVMFHANQAIDMEDMSCLPVAEYIPQIAIGFGLLGDVGSTGSDLPRPFRFVDTAYGAAASTAVAPTTTTLAAPAFLLVK